MDYTWRKWGDNFSKKRCVHAIRKQCASKDDDFDSREEKWISDHIEQLQFGESVDSIHIISITTFVTLMILTPSLNIGSTLENDAKVLVSQSNRGNHQIARIDDIQTLMDISVSSYFSYSYFGAKNYINGNSILFLDFVRYGAPAI